MMPSQPPSCRGFIFAPASSFVSLYHAAFREPRIPLGSANVGSLMKHYPPTWGYTFKTFIGCLSFVFGVLLVAVALYLVATLVMEWAGYLYGSSVS